MNTLLRSLLALTMLLSLTACGGGYRLAGKVVRGDFAGVMIVDPDDEQLREPGVGNVQIELYRDPDRPNRSLAVSGRSKGDGRVDLTIDAFGAGWMEEQWLIQVVKPGYETLQQLVTLPSSGKEKRLLIMLSPGVSIAPEPQENLWDEYERYR